jgi:RNA polymerase sigma-70 factor, ECF subfamily
MDGDAENRRIFDELVAANQRRIVAIARSFTRGDEYQDLCQEILLQMWRGMGGFQGRCAPATWVYRVALNTAISFRRKNGRRIEFSTMPAGSEPPAPAGTENALIVLHEFLRSLGEIDRAVFLLYLEDLTYREMSEITGLTESNVGVHINRLKRLFTERYGGG